MKKSVKIAMSAALALSLFLILFLKNDRSAESNGPKVTPGSSAQNERRQTPPSDLQVSDSLAEITQNTDSAPTEDLITEPIAEILAQEDNDSTTYTFRFLTTYTVDGKQVDGVKLRVAFLLAREKYSYINNFSRIEYHDLEEETNNELEVGFWPEFIAIRPVHKTALLPATSIEMPSQEDMIGNFAKVQTNYVNPMPTEDRTYSLAVLWNENLNDLTVFQNQQPKFISVPDVTEAITLDLELKGVSHSNLQIEVTNLEPDEIIERIHTYVTSDQSEVGRRIYGEGEYFGNLHADVYWKLKDGLPVVEGKFISFDPWYAGSHYFEITTNQWRYAQTDVIFVPPGEQHRETVELHEGAQLDVYTVSNDLEPVPNVEVFITRGFLTMSNSRFQSVFRYLRMPNGTFKEDSEPKYPDLLSGLKEWGKVDTNLTNSDGVATFPGNSPGLTKVIAMYKGIPYEKEIVFEKGRKGEVYIELPTNEVHLELFVTDEEGKGIEEGFVKLNPVGVSGKEFQTELEFADGYAECNIVPQGYYVSVYSEGYVPLAKKLEFDSTEKQCRKYFVLMKRNSKEFRIVDHNDRPLEGVFAEVRFAGQHRVTAISDPDGTFRGEIISGNGIVTASRVFLEKREFDVNMPEPIVIQYKPVNLEVTLTDKSTGQPFAEPVLVQIEPIGVDPQVVGAYIWETQFHGLAIGANGREGSVLAFNNIPMQPYNVIRRNSYDSEILGIFTPDVPGKTYQLNFEIGEMNSEFGAVSGKIHNNFGETISVYGSFFSLEGKKLKHMMVFSDLTGEFSSNKIPEGDYVIQFHQRAYEPLLTGDTYVPKFSDVFTVEADKEVVLMPVLQLGGGIVAYFRNDQRTPFTGLEPVLLTADGDDSWNTMQGTRSLPVTDQEGLAWWSGLPQGTYVVTATLPNGERIERHVDVFAGEVANLDIEVPTVQ